MKIISIIAIAILVAWDTIYTAFLLSCGFVEKNNKMAWCLDKLGTAWTLILSEIVMVGILVLFALTLTDIEFYIGITVCGGWFVYVLLRNKKLYDSIRS